MDNSSKYSPLSLDDNGAAFFVEDVEDEEWSPHLATSPIPSTGSWEWNKVMDNDNRGENFCVK